ncbi:MAG TPA: histidinol phosphate phosphatase [Lentisphaeria bacterium]|nr:histidinol-phosphatase [Lentisphaeria bacterium]HCG24691.1 histidinol phosphate phosphatase [Lentisphaeria bacterium]HCG50771.1 histidinol phosphate phosphatase [Lentisphaeria bacterium]
MFADLHTHTSLCKHADGTPEEYFENACKRGLSYLGVSDHIPWPAGYDTSSRMNPEQYSEYRSIVRRLRESAENTPVKVLYGIELDWVPGRMDEVSREIQEEPFDYLIGSIHYVGDFAFDNPYEIEKWDSIGVDHVWNRYAGLMCEFVQNFKFDIMGHADLPKKFGHRPSDPSKFMKKMREALTFAGERGIAIEINTCGLRKPVKEMYPSLEILKAAREAGMPLTFGSDAHSPEEIASDFDRAAELAQAAGYRSALAFEQRRPVELPFR